MKYILSRYNHDIDWVKNYTDDVVMYDRSPEPIKGSIVVPNIGSDIYDKFSYIIDNYNNLPDVALYTKANLFKYITPEEFELVKDNTTFTPLFTKHHPEKMCDWIENKKFCFYSEDGMYNEHNTNWFANGKPFKYNPNEMRDILNIRNQEYIKFAPGSNYILPKENILKHPKEFYVMLRSWLDYDIYPSEAMLIERALYSIWQ